MDWNEYGEIVGISNSLRKYYGLETYHGTDQDVDAWLQQNHFRCVMALLVDAMGVSVMQKHLKKDGFFMKHLIKPVTTVFPPTTSAATTSFRTGKYPIENGWLGWNQYFKEKDDNIILFLNSAQYSDTQYPGFSEEALPVPDLTEQLNEKGIGSTSVWPIWGYSYPSESYHDLLMNSLKAVNDPGNHYVYTYWDAFDTLMHQVGPSSDEAGDMLREIEKETEVFVEQLPDDCGLLIIADHSQIDVHSKALEEDVQLCACFRHEPALEPRTIAFYIEDEKKEQFVRLFNEHYGKDYHLYTKAEVNSLHIFGEGIEHPRFQEFIGDYLAVAETNLQLLYRKKRVVKGDHAGGMTEEAVIPLILCTHTHGNSVVK